MAWKSATGAQDDAVRTTRPEECISRAEAAKEAGNALFRRGDARQALDRYREGLELVQLFNGKVPARTHNKELRHRADMIFLALHLNASQTCLKLRDWAGAADHADRVLCIDPQNVKALYRRAVARSMAESTLDQACADFSKVLELDPQNKEAREQLDKTRDRLRTFYDLLGAHPRATTSQIRHAYLREAKRWHPDKAAKEDKALATQRFKNIAEAHEVLRNTELRQLYDLYLQFRSQGFLELPDAEDPGGGVVHVPFQDWNDFRRILEGGMSSAGSRQDANNMQESSDDLDDPPLSIFEWMIAGGALLAVWCVSVWRHNRRQWLKSLPLDIYLVHEEYSIPMALLMSPFFFGNVPWDDTVRWIRAMVEQAVLT